MSYFRAIFPSNSKCSIVALFTDVSNSITNTTVSLHPSVDHADIFRQPNQFMCMHECCHSIKDSQFLSADVSNLITSLYHSLSTHQLTFLSNPTNSFVCTNAATAFKLMFIYTTLYLY